MDRPPDMELASTGILRRDEPPPPRPRPPRSWLIDAFLVGLACGIVAHLASVRDRRRDSPAETVAFSRAWEVRWRSATAGVGRVQVRDGTDGAWASFDEGAAGRAVHAVRFTAWPRAGRTLEYRTVVGDGAPGPARPLRVSGHLEAIDLATEESPTSLTVTWKTATPGVGLLSVDTGGKAAHEGTATQCHRITLRDLGPGSFGRATLATTADERGATAQIRYALPTVAATVRELGRRIAWGREAVRQLQTAFDAHPLSPAEAQGQGKAWRQFCTRWAQRPDVRRAADWYGEVAPFVLDDPDLDPVSAAWFLKNVGRIGDVERLVRSIFDVDAGLPRELRAWPVLQDRPRGVVPFLAIRFADGGAGADRPPPFHGLEPTSVVPPPAKFAEDSLAFFSPAVYRFEYHEPGPIARLGPVRNVHLFFRLLGGPPTDRVVVQAGDRRVFGRGLPELAVMRCPGTQTVRQGYVKVDERLVASPRASLRISLDADLSRLRNDYPTLEWLVLLGEPCKAWPRGDGFTAGASPAVRPRDRPEAGRGGAARPSR